MEVPLDIVLEGELHVVAQVIEPELVVRAVGDVAAVGLAPLLVGEPVNDDAHREPEKIVDGAHPGGIALRQVVVDRDEVDTPSREGIEVQGHGRGKGFPFARLHLGDLALVEHDASDELHVKGPHPHGPPCRFPHDGKGFRQDVVEGGPVCELLLEIGCFRLQFFVGEFLDGRLEMVDLVNERRNALQLPLIFCSEYFLNEIQHGSA